MKLEDNQVAKTDAIKMEKAPNLWAWILAVVTGSSVKAEMDKKKRKGVFAPLHKRDREDEEK